MRNGFCWLGKVVSLRLPLLVKMKYLGNSRSKLKTKSTFFLHFFAAKTSHFVCFGVGCLEVGRMGRFGYFVFKNGTSG
jgi:hypothetical protein